MPVIQSLTKLFFKFQNPSNREVRNMSLFSVDSKKCNRDGICAAECPTKIIVLENKEAVPMPVPGAEELCINCYDLSGTGSSLPEPWRMLGRLF